MSLPDDLPLEIGGWPDAPPTDDEWASLCEAAGLDVRTDDAGHTTARWSPPSVDAGQTAVVTGSQQNAVDPDEMLALHGGLEAVRALQRVGFQPQRPIELVRFNPTTDAHHQTKPFHAGVGLRTDPTDKLTQQNAAVGIAMSVTGSASYAFHVTGEDGDAGAVPMPERRDALCAAAETIHAIEQFARSSPSLDLTATVTRFTAAPGQPGRIPSQARFVLELHDTETDNRDQIAEAIYQECNTIALRRGLKITSEPQYTHAPVACDKLVIDAIEHACDAADLRWWKMISPPTPGLQRVAETTPVGLILIPDHDPPHLHAGVEILARTLVKLAT